MLSGNIKAVIFDLDGTLIDSMWMWDKLLPDYLAAHGIEIPKQMLSRVKLMTLTQSSEYVAETFPQLSVTAGEMLAIWTDMVYENYSSRVKLKDGAYEFLRKLKNEGKRIAVATACQPELAEVCLRNNGVIDMIDVFTYAEEVGAGKDSPEIYLECLRRLCCGADEAVLFEDLAEAMLSARSIGLKTVVVEDESAAAERDFLMREADGYIKDFTELL